MNKKYKTTEHHIIRERNYPPRLERHQLILKNLNFDQINSVLDIGCGFGEFLELVNNDVEKVGTDFDDDCLLQAQQSVKANFLKVNIDNGLPFKNSSFDLIVATDVIEHVNNPTLLLKEVLRVCKKTAVFVTPNLGRPTRMAAAMLKREIRERSGHKQGWDYHLFKQVLEVCGWKVDKIITRFVDFPSYRYLPKSVGHFFSYKLLLKIFPRIGSELFAFCTKKTDE
jgi:ubiquinone/menaquinone biosynthesis C-methylase UbiE